MKIGFVGITIICYTVWKIAILTAETVVKVAAAKAGVK